MWPHSWRPGNSRSPREAELFAQHSFCCWHSHSPWEWVGTISGYGTGWWAVLVVTEWKAQNSMGLGCRCCCFWALSLAPCRCAVSSAGPVCVSIPRMPSNQELCVQYGAGCHRGTQKHETWGLPQIAPCLLEETRLVHIKAFICPTDTYLLGW